MDIYTHFLLIQYTLKELYTNVLLNAFCTELLFNNSVVFFAFVQYEARKHQIQLQLCIYHLHFLNIYGPIHYISLSGKVSPL